jgi:hypothetical protein
MRPFMSMLFLAAVTVSTAIRCEAQHRRSVFGAKVRLVRYDGLRSSGELLAAQGDSLWLLASGAMYAVPLDKLQDVQVRRPGIDAVGILGWALVGGLVTGRALTAACSTVAEDCGGVFVGTMLSWGLVGGIAAAITRSPHRWLSPGAAALAPYARFPQGLPPGFVANTSAGIADDQRATSR